jgi:hypothetical protein
LQKEDLTNPDNVIQLGYKPNRIDLTVHLDGLDFNSCYSRREEVVFNELNVHFIGYEDLIQNKLSTGRMKDKVDARTLEKKTKKNRPK